MKLLLTIAHFFGGSRHDGEEKSGKYASQRADAATRLRAIRGCVDRLHQSFGSFQAMIYQAERRTVPANTKSRHEIHSVIVVAGNNHLLNEANFPEQVCQPFSIDDDPMHMGFHCQTIMRDRRGNYDYYGYVEDDLILNDAWFFDKLKWFNGHVDNKKVLLLNRFEFGDDLAYKKCYLDGDLASRVTENFQDITQDPELRSTVMGKSIRFVRPLNPHSGCYFPNADQMKTWINQPHFGQRDSSFVGPLESAATLGVMKTFQIYKPAPENANFFEIQHHGHRFLSLVRLQT
ncbi:calcium-binding protein [Planctomycetes bacterium K23_9]|uniref:Calcium-binding protein n=1 Tax=Stieleria marina TaxID=1930275 RepID=A0A517NM34_9BACT|nr:hypothetical protein K239x_00650 [Planctomycetes bacterium K23_9]